jgi:hypothetical protein
VARPAGEDRGFGGYLGGGRFQTMAERAQAWNGTAGVGEPRAMFEFRPADEDCPSGCPKCPPRLKRRSWR